MTGIKNSYEAVVMLSSKLSDEERTAVVEKLQDLVKKSANLDEVDDWGKKRLAYLVNKESEAYYVLFKFTAESTFPAEFERICKITSGVMRVLVVNVSEQ